MSDYTAAIQEIVRVHGLWLIPFFPALGAFINLLFGALLQQRFGKRIIHAIAVGSMAFASVTALYFFIIKLLPLAPEQRFLWDDVFPMIQIGAVQVRMALAMDPLGGLMATMVTLIATAIHIYSIGYMHNEPSYWRFFAYLNLFCFSMLMLVLGDNFILMFFGWEGVGLCSYLLIGFWYKDRAKASAGMKAFVVNRIGDFGFIVGMFTLFWGLLGVWEAIPAQVESLDDGRCVAVRTVGLPLHSSAHSGDGAALDHASTSVSHHDETGKPLVPASSSTPSVGRCNTAFPVTVGSMQRLYVGPTVSFRELKDQLSIENKDGRRVVAENLSAAKLFGVGLLILVTFGLFLGAAGKSAQIPLYVWLPDAMAGPTPVSALIHAATMVTAGVYMVARLNFIFILSPEGMTLVALVGALTALFAATIGLFQYDIKKVLAYSTVSQLGFMFVGVGVGAYWVGIYHVLTHAFFKACLFLGSGSVIHGMHWVEHRHEDNPGLDGQPSSQGHVAPQDLRLAPNSRDPQDMRNMGGLARLMPSTRTTYLIGCLAIAGVPGFSGFFSKDEILWQAFSTGNILVSGKIIWALCAMAAFCTAFYMFRSFFMTFYGKAPSDAHRAHVHESPRVMTWVLWFLAAGAILAGVIGLPKLWTGREPLIEQFLAPSMALSSKFSKAATVHGTGIEAGLMLLSILIAAGGFALAYMLYWNLSKTEQRLNLLKLRFSRVHTLVFCKYFVDELYQATVVKGMLALTRLLAWIDLHIVDGIVNSTSYMLRAMAALSGAIDRVLVDGMVNGVAEAIIASGRRMRLLQTGRLNTYVAGTTFGVVVLLVVLWFVAPS